MNAKRAKRAVILAIAGLLTAGLALGGCLGPASEQSQLPGPTRTLRSQPLIAYTAPFATASPAAGPPATTATPLPSLTPTPRIHVVQKGEDMFGIALRYGIQLEELMAANPEVRPNIMSVGTQLVIPGTAPAPVENTPGTAPSPTPVAVILGKLFCARLQDGSAWCSLPVTNPQEVGLEGVSAIFRMTNAETLEETSLTAFPPLDVLPPGKVLPLSAHFTGPIPETFQAGAEILSSLPNPSDGRYVSARAENQKVFLSEDGLSAGIQLDVLLEQAGETAGRVWVAAWAYDHLGNVVGVRRWEMPAGQTLPGGQALPVQMQVYSSAGRIEKVELAVEARP